MADMYFTKNTLRIINDAGEVLSLSGDPVPDHIIASKQVENYFHRVETAGWMPNGEGFHGFPDNGSPEEFLRRLAEHLGASVCFHGDPDNGSAVDGHGICTECGQRVSPDYRVSRLGTLQV